MPTYTALTTLPDGADAEALAAAMEDMTPAPTGVGVFEMEDGSGLWEVGAYFDARPAESALALLAAAYGAHGFAISELPEIDWVAKVRRELSPVEAGRFFVYGSHDADKVPSDRVALLIEAQMAFGTGHHGTTLGCLRAFERLLQSGWRGHDVLDLGCGTAVLAMAAARVLDARVMASDIDDVAVEVAEANLAANGLSGRVAVVQASGFDHPGLDAAAPFDLVFGNILKGPLLELAPQMARHVTPGGHAILSGLLTSQAAEILEAYTACGFAQAAREDIGEWTTLTLIRGD